MSPHTTSVPQSLFQGFRTLADAQAAYAQMSAAGHLRVLTRRDPKTRSVNPSSVPSASYKVYPYLGREGVLPSVAAATVVFRGLQPGIYSTWYVICILMYFWLMYL